MVVGKGHGPLPFTEFRRERFLMNACWTGLLFLGLCWLLPGMARGADGAKPGEVVFGAVAQGTASVCVSAPGQRLKGTAVDSDVTLLQAGVAGGGEVSKYLLPFSLTQTYQPYPPRWRLAHDFYWAVSVREFAPNQRVIRLVRIPLSKLDTFRVGPSGSLPGLQTPLPLESCGKIDPLNVAYLRPGGNKTAVHYDCLPTAADRCTLLILSGRRLTAWHGTIVFDEEKKSRYLRWSEAETLGADLDEPFFAAARGEEYSLVTASGKVYRVGKAKDGSRKVETVWADAQRPVRVVLTDVDRGKTFAFGGPGDPGTDAGGFFFEIKDRLEPRSFERGSIKPVKVGQPLRTVAEYAQILAGKGRGKE
jgi:hypothetical protein